METERTEVEDFSLKMGRWQADAALQQSLEMILLDLKDVDMPIEEFRKKIELTNGTEEHSGDRNSTEQTDSA